MLSRLTIRARVISAFVMIMCATAGLGLFSVARMSMINDDSETIAADWLPSANVLGTLAQDFELFRGLQSQILMHSGEDRTELLNEMSTARAKVEADLKAYAPYVSEGAETALAQDLTRAVTLYMAQADPYLNKVEANLDDEATVLFLDTMQPLAVDVRKAIKADREFQINEGEKAAKLGIKTGRNAETLILIALGVTACACFLIGWAMIRTISLPISRMAGLMRLIARGDLTITVPNLHEKNEIGDMAMAVEVFKDGLIRNKALEADAIKARDNAEMQRKKIMSDLATSFENAVGGIVEMVSSAATEMQATASQLTASAQEASVQATSVSAAAEEAGTNVTSVAGSAEELGASVQEISRQVEHSSQKAREAVAEADTTAAIVNELSEAAGRINGIVDMITSIASQTNLLALNATIESARAGDAGKGFAVVASEVKQLAGQTSRATAEISQHIAGIQGTTERAVEAIRNITGTIRDINASSTTIAAAVDQQGAATNEIVQAVSQASAGTTEVTLNITGVARMATETGAGASQVLSASSELAHQAEHLRTQVSAFIAQIRAA